MQTRNENTVRIIRIFSRKNNSCSSVIIQLFIVFLFLLLLVSKTIFYIVEVVKLVIVTITRQCDPEVSEHSVSLNDSTDNHSAKEAEESEEEGEDPGPKAAAAGVTAGVTLPAGRAL